MKEKLKAMSEGTKRFFVRYEDVIVQTSGIVFCALIGTAAGYGMRKYIINPEIRRAYGDGATDAFMALSKAGVLKGDVGMDVRTMKIDVYKGIEDMKNLGSK